jgi:hypothetical protein
MLIQGLSSSRPTRFVRRDAQGCDSSRIKNIALATQKEPSAATSILPFPSASLEGRNPPNCDVHGRGACPLNVDSSHRLRTNTRLAPTAGRTALIDAKRNFRHASRVGCVRRKANFANSPARTAAPYRPRRRVYAKRPSSACASAISGISGVGEQPLSAGARIACASSRRPLDW